ncbi:hypothetical protein BH11BAC3_BH11BAC3_18180 [soil metagenome]
MNGQKHIIKKFTVELNGSSVTQSHTLQQRCLKVINQDVVRGMDTILSAYFKDDAVTKINKIDIDLGNISIDELEKDFLEKYLTSFTNKIKSIKSQYEHSGNEEIIVAENDNNLLHQFYYFLVSGKMYWAAFNTDIQQWENEIIAAIKLNPTSFKNTFLKLITKHPVAIERLVLQFNTQFILQLIEVYNSKARQSYEQITIVLKQIKPTYKISVAEKPLLIAVMQLILGVKGNESVNVIQDFIEWLGRQSVLNANDIRLSQFTRSLMSIVKINELNMNVADETNAEEGAGGITKIDTSDESEGEITAAELNDESVYINNAGIIMLHPFLQNFFTTTGLMEGQNFKDDFSKQKAVHLLQYLATGQQQLPEYLMPLNKLLCGLSAAEHIDRFIQLKPEEINEAAALLTAVIDHWKVLKNTSIEGLQETFLQRNGKLSFNEVDNYWKLVVERNAVDILLEKIPWGISYIQLPWMKYPLSVEW